MQVGIILLQSVYFGIVGVAWHEKLERNKKKKKKKQREIYFDAHILLNSRYNCIKPLQSLVPNIDIDRLTNSILLSPLSSGIKNNN